MTLKPKMGKKLQKMNKNWPKWQMATKINEFIENLGTESGTCTKNRQNGQKLAIFSSLFRPRSACSKMRIFPFHGPMWKSLCKSDVFHLGLGSEMSQDYIIWSWKSGH